MANARTVMVWGLLISGMVVAGGLATASAQGGGGQRIALKGLKAIAVQVVPLGTRVQEAGLSASELQTDAELQLRKAGIAVVNATKSPSEQLVVNVTCDSDPQRIVPVLACNVAVQFYQPVALVRDPAIQVVTPTWEEDSVAWVGLDRVSILRSGASDMVEEFANDYLAVNRKR